MRHVSAGRLASITLTCGSLLVGCAGPSPEGVVLLVVDTLRADHLGCYGYRRPTSPSLDQWATEGRLFERALSTAPWTLPSIASMLTGRLPSAHLAGWEVPGGAGEKASYAPDGRQIWQSTALGAELPTLPERLRDAGVATAAFASNPFLSPRFGLARGFDVYENYPDTKPGEEILEAALDWLEGVDGRYFLLLHLMEPHLPYEPPEHTRGAFAHDTGEDGSLREVGNLRQRLASLTEGQRNHIRALYDEEILAVDLLVDTLRLRLASSGRLPSSLVVLVSDHGEELFDHGGFEHGHAVYQEVVAVPLIFWGPGVRPGRDETPVSVVDLPATILEAMALDSEGFPAGHSLWPLLRRQEPLEPRPLLAEATLYGPELKVLVDWPLKLIVDWRDGTASLYDLEADPAETRDLAPAKPELTAHLLSQLERRVAEASRSAGDLTAPEDLTPELIRELRALGYLGN